MVSAAAAIQLLDHRGIAKVPIFSGRRQDFEEWAFPFESYCSLLGWEAYVTNAVRNPAEIEIVDLLTEPEAVGRSLYHLLVSTVKCTALSVVKLTERGNRLEAIRRLYIEFRPRLNEEHGSMLQMILTPTWWKERDNKATFTEILITWDERVARYEQAT